MNWLWIAISAFGFSGLCLAAAVFFLGWPVLIAFARTKVGMAVIGICTAGVGLLILYRKALDDGAQRERERQERIDAEAIARHKQDVEDIRRLSDDELNRRLLDSSIK